MHIQQKKRIIFHSLTILPAPGDYDAQTLTAVTIQPNEDSSTVPVTIALDGATEGLESLFGRLQAQSGEPVDIIQENATIEILDDDGIYCV